jgi:hypothetical protein
MSSTRDKKGIFRLQSGTGGPYSKTFPVSEDQVGVPHASDPESRPASDPPGNDMAAVAAVIYGIREREQDELERGQSAEEIHDSILMKKARAALTIKKFIMRRSYAVGSRTVLPR